MLTAVLLLASVAAFAQPVQDNSLQQAKYRTEIGLDLSVPNFNTKAIDAKVMGTRLAGVLDYLLETYQQTVYNRKLTQILKEQVPELEYQEFQLTKVQFVSAQKVGEEINIQFTVWLTENKAKIKKATLAFHFKDGVSKSNETNELFSKMSNYVQRREQLKELEK